MSNEIRIMVNAATQQFTQVLSVTTIKSQYPTLYWGGNGVGDRWANKLFNYTVILGNGNTKTYSENDDDTIPPKTLRAFLHSVDKSGSGIVGIFVHSQRTNIVKRPIRKDIIAKVTNKSCVVCGTKKTICDHKNDLYNDNRVLHLCTQLLTDFQPLCNHCNLQKRQVCKDELRTGKIYSAKNIATYAAFPFDFPWEKKQYDKSDVCCKQDTYWYDPVEFNNKIYIYSTCVYPLLSEIRRKIKLVT